MPKIISYTPPWLSRPALGSQAFTNFSEHEDSPAKSSSGLGSPARQNTHQPYDGPHRLLARRGNEIFVVVGNQIRWLDLHMLKNDWEEQSDFARSRNHPLELQDGEGEISKYRVLVAPVYQQIRQLIVSPSGHFLAILTEHTVHVAVLPDPSHLATRDKSPLKVKTHQLGPTTHVLPQSPVVSALWHPLACSTTSFDCLVTVTAEAAVRVWELDRSNTWSYDRPSLAIDLQKLVDGTSCDEDFEPSGFGKSRGFSADSFDMEVAAACFGGHAREGEDGWASMTLWIAMRNGDAYALCPLLPSKWRPVSTLIPSLSTSVVSNMACINDDSADPDARRAVQQQFEWVQEIDNEDPTPMTAAANLSVLGEVRSRPLAPSAIPRLQGPYLFDLEENELDLEISDILVIPAKVNAEDLLSGEEEDYTDLEGLIQDRLSTTVICLATLSGKVHICLELETVSGQWLPKSKKGAFTVPVGEAKELVLVESIQTGNGAVGSQDWPLFSPDPISPYDFYLTLSGRVVYLSLSAWASRLEAELLSPVIADTGRDFRLRVLCGDGIVLTEEILDCSDDTANNTMEHLAGALVIHNSDLGYFLLTSSRTRPFAVTFDIPDTGPRALTLARANSTSSSPNAPRAKLDLTMSDSEAIVAPPRVAYEPSAVFYQLPTQPLREFLASNVPQRYKATLKQGIRLSPSTLDIMTAAHRILSSQTSQLEQAAAELFRRCERLREELAHQVKHMAELSERIQRNESSAEDENEDRNTSCERRLARATDRQQNLNERYETLRRKIGRATAGGRELSNKEKAWITEISELSSSFGVDSEMDVDEPSPQLEKSIESRIGTVHDLAASLLEEAEELHRSQQITTPPPKKNGLVHSPSNTSPISRLSGSSVPLKLQKAKLEEVMHMVEREAAVIDAVMARLERLNQH